MFERQRRGLVCEVGLLQKINLLLKIELEVGKFELWKPLVVLQYQLIWLEEQV